MIKLFNAHSVVNNFAFGGHVYNELPIFWYVAERKAPVVPYEQAIRNYRKERDPFHLYPESAIDELFTEEELNALKEYLLRVHKIEFKIEQVELPISFFSRGLSTVSVGDGTDHYLFYLYREDTYNLPFKVEGLFIIRGAEENHEEE